MLLPILRRVVFGLGCAAGAASVALAGSFQVSPVRIDLGAARPTAVLRVVNLDAQPVTVQAGARTWSYAGEQDVFGETDDVLLNPPIFTIAPGATQFVRVGLRTRAAPASEASYRLFLEELPSQAAPAGTGVRTLLRISLPVFVAPPGNKAAARIEWRIARSGAAETRLSATNSGPVHIQLQGISLRPLGGEAIESRNVASYLLPGQTREWKIPGAALAAARQVELSARSDAGNFSESLAPTDR